MPKPLLLLLILALVVAETHAQPLIEAVEIGNLRTIGNLLDGGADVTAEDAEGYDALSKAARYGKVAVARLLLEHGADPNRQNSTEYQTTPLMEASIDGYVAVAQLLLDHGADPDVRDVNGDTALNWATFFGQTRFVETLIAAEANLNMTGQDDFTALDTALLYAHDDIIDQLIAAGAAEGSVSPTGAQLLDAVKQNDLTQITSLLAEGADPATKDAAGTPALVWAASKGHTDALTLLLDAGAPPDARNRIGFDALLSAARDGHTEALSLLLDRGADINTHATGKGLGLTPLMIASMRGQIPTIELLIERGADLQATSRNRKTALDWAQAFGQGYIAEMLKKMGAAPLKPGQRDP